MGFVDTRLGVLVSHSEILNNLGVLCVVATCFVQRLCLFLRRIFVVSDEKMSNYESIVFAVIKFIPETQFSLMFSSSVAKFTFSHEVGC